MPPEAAVNPTESPPTDKPDNTKPTFCNFEEDLCNWTEDSGLNATANFVWSRTSGKEQDGLTGPSEDYNHSGESNN